MSSPPGLRTLTLLVRDTFQSAQATRLFWLALALSGLCILICLSVGIEAGQPLRAAGEVELYRGDGQPLTGRTSHPGHLTLAFGAFRVPLFRDGPAMAHLLHVVLAKWVAGAAGTLLLLVWTAGFVPEFLQPAEIAILLAKPVSRATRLWGRVAGVLVFVGFLALVFIAGTWVALGLRTGVWSGAYLLSLPLLRAHFTMIHGASVALAVWARNTAVCALGSITFWLVYFAVSSGHDALRTLPRTAPDLTPSGPTLGLSVDTAYWVLPKPVDIAAALDTALDAGQHITSTPGLGPARVGQKALLSLAIGSSLAFSLLLVLAAGWSFERLDY